jgi:hypothetical protein
VEDDTRARQDPALLSDIHSETWLLICLRGSHVLCCQVISLARLIIDSNLRDTLGYGSWLVL